MTDDEVSGEEGRLYPVPLLSAAPLLVAGVVLGALGDALLRVGTVTSHSEWP